MWLDREWPNLIGWAIALTAGYGTYRLVHHFWRGSWGEAAGIALGVALALVILRTWYIATRTEPPAPM